MSTGTRLETKAEILPEGATLRPLRDRIVIKPLEFEPSKVIQIAGSKRRTLRGKVVSIGPGTYHRTYRKNHRGERAGFKDSRYRVPMEVKVGDVVELGYLVVDGEDTCYGFTEVYLGTERHFICQQQDVVGIHV